MRLSCPIKCFLNSTYSVEVAVIASGAESNDKLKVRTHLHSWSGLGVHGVNASSVVLGSTPRLFIDSFLSCLTCLSCLNVSVGPFGSGVKPKRGRRDYPSASVTRGTCRCLGTVPSLPAPGLGIWGLVQKAVSGGGLLVCSAFAIPSSARDERKTERKWETPSGHRSLHRFDLDLDCQLTRFRPQLASPAGLHPGMAGKNSAGDWKQELTTLRSLDAMDQTGETPRSAWNLGENMGQVVGSQKVKRTKPALGK